MSLALAARMFAVGATQRIGGRAQRSIAHRGGWRAPGSAAAVRAFAPICAMSCVLRSGSAFMLSMMPVLAGISTARYTGSSHARPSAIRLRRSRMLPAGPGLRTTRLLLRPLVAEDAPVFHRLINDWEICRRLPDAPFPYPGAAGGGLDRGGGAQTVRQARPSSSRLWRRQAARCWAAPGCALAGTENPPSSATGWAAPTGARVSGWRPRGGW